MYTADKIAEEYFQDFYNKPGWVYHDLPRMSPEFFDQFVEIVGQENLLWITFADYGTSKRGQVMISPEGMQNLKEYNDEQKNLGSS